MWQDAKALNATANGILALVLCVCAAAGVYWLAHRPVFDLRTIRVEPLSSPELRHVNLLTLKNGTQGRIRGNFFTANLENVRQVFEAVPWVEEHEALGTWGDDGRLLSVKGDVFTANLAEAEEDHELPQFSGPDGSEKEVLARYAELRKWFAPAKLVPEGLALSGRYAWTVLLDNGTSVALGREQTPTTLKARVDRLVSIWPQLAARVPDIETIDMRYQNGLALAAKGLKIPAEKVK
jgi:cell division protein FtsQ